MTTRARGVVAVTGAYGYLGSVISDAFRAQDWDVRALVRSPRSTDTSARRFDLGETPDTAAFAGVDVLVHCAYDLTLTRDDAIRRVNVEGTDRLLQSATDGGVRRSVVISSIAAFAGTTQVYGRAKLAIEAIAQRHGAAVLRPGLVYGPSSGGMVGALRKVVHLPVVPLLAGHSFQYMAHESDLAATVVMLATTDEVPDTPVTLAHPRPVPFREVLATIAAADGRPARFVPMPWRAAFGALRGAELLGLRPPFKADSLWGLAHPPPAPAADPAIPISPRPFSAESLGAR